VLDDIERMEREGPEIVDGIKRKPLNLMPRDVALMVRALDGSRAN
jgi:hypothetical protein